jgi:hypothetical protein
MQEGNILAMDSSCTRKENSKGNHRGHRGKESKGRRNGRKGRARRRERGHREDRSSDRAKQVIELADVDMRLTFGWC